MTNFSLKKKKIDDFSDPLFKFKLAFVVDLTTMLNQLNITMQGKNNLILDSFDQIKYFKIKLSSLIEDCDNSDFFQFINAEEVFKENNLGENSSFNSKSFSDFLKNLLSKFNSRFSDFDKQDSFELFLRPFLAKRNKIPIHFQNELREMIKLNLEVEFNKCISNEDKMNFFKHLPCEFTNFKNNAKKILSMFPTSYLCEQFFSKLKLRKNNYSSLISSDNLQSCLRVSCSDSEPNFTNLIHK